MSDASKGGMLAVFAELDAAVEAIERLRDRGHTDMTVYSPLPSHDLEHAIDPPQSPVRLFTLVGGLTGAATGFALAIWTSLDWPLITGGKAIISLPAFVVIAFELTILFGALSTVVGLFINARLPQTGSHLIYDPAFSSNRFGIEIAPSSGAADEVRRILRDAGAEEVREGRTAGVTS